MITAGKCLPITACSRIVRQWRCWTVQSGLLSNQRLPADRRCDSQLVNPIEINWEIVRNSQHACAIGKSDAGLSGSSWVHLMNFIESSATSLLNSKRQRTSSKPYKLLVGVRLCCQTPLPKKGVLWSPESGAIVRPTLITTLFAKFPMLL